MLETAEVVDVVVADAENIQSAWMIWRYWSQIRGKIRDAAIKQIVEELGGQRVVWDDRLDGANPGIKIEFSGKSDYVFGFGIPNNMGPCFFGVKAEGAISMPESTEIFDALTTEFGVGKTQHNKENWWCWWVHCKDIIGYNHQLHKGWDEGPDLLIAMKDGSFAEAVVSDVRNIEELLRKEGKIVEENRVEL